MRATLALILVACAVLAGCDGGEEGPAPDESAQAAITGILDATQVSTGAECLGKVAWYDAGNLHQYIDGMAPEFVDAGFVLLVHSEWREKESEGPGYVELDLYDMGSPQGSALVFDEPDPGSPGLPLPGGVKAYAGDAMIEFHTDRYYVKLTARRDPAGQQTLLRDLAAAVAEAAAPALVTDPAGRNSG